jgi:hypothetical protein
MVSRKYVVFTSEEAAVNREQQITDAANFTDGVTQRYAAIYKQQSTNQWALIIEPGYEQYFTAGEIAASRTITDTWHPIN